MAGPLDIDSDEFDPKAFVADIKSRGEEADKQSLWEKTMEATAKPGLAEGQAKASKQVFGWLKNLPKNITVGTLDAIDAMADFADEASEGAKGETKPKGQKPFLDSTGQDYDDPLSAAWRGGLNELRTRLSKNDTMSDDITQGVAQFAVPFTGWMKAMKGSAAAGKLGLIMQAGAAEAATVGTAFAPDSGRVADLLQAGREMEGRLGETLRKLSPDGSALNGYIDYMTDRSDETVADARWKNIVDSLAVSAGVGALLKAAPVAMKTGRYALENAGNGPVGMSAQGGWIGYHGTPHNVEKFDMSKVGTGEGQQAYGHGLYFAEAKDVANTYRGAGNIVHQIASANLYKHKGDWQKSVEDLKSRGDNRSAAAARMLEQSKGKLEGGNLYEVEIPDDVVAKMLDYDADMAKQESLLAKIPSKDVAAMEDLLDEAGYAADITALTGKQFQEVVGKAIKDDRIAFIPADGDFFNERKLAAEYLNGLDIPGVRYLDGGSRKGPGDAVTKGTRNLVLFDDKHVKIKGKE